MHNCSFVFENLRLALSEFETLGDSWPPWGKWCFLHPGCVVFLASCYKRNVIGTERACVCVLHALFRNHSQKTPVRFILSPPPRLPGQPHVSVLQSSLFGSPPTRTLSSLGTWSVCRLHRSSGAGTKCCGLSPSYKNLPPLPLCHLL